MTFADPLPSWALLAAAAICTLLPWAAYRRVPLPLRQRMTLALLRGAALAWLVICLMRPVVVARPVSGNAIVPVLIDMSRSMSLPDGDGRQRIQQARAISEQIVKTARDLNVELLGFGDGLSPVTVDSLRASERHTNIGGALRAVRDRYRGQPVAGILLLSDGGDNGPSSPDQAAADGPPVFPVGIGPAGPLRDREVLSVTTADALLDGATVDITATAVQHGYGKASFELRLLENGKPIDVRSVRPASDGSPVSTVFSVSPPPRMATVYTVEVPSSADELVLDNNARSVVSPPPRAPVRLLFVQGAPGFDHAFLKRALASDRAMRIDTVIRKGKDDRGQDTFYVQTSRPDDGGLVAGLPSTRASLFAYDVVVLANVDADELNAAEADLLRAFVTERGGGLLVLGARAFDRGGLRETALETVLPLDLSDRASAVVSGSGAVPLMNRVTLTSAGAAHPIMQIGGSPDESRKRWASLPPLASVSPLGAPRAGSTVLAVTAGPGGLARALIAVQRTGEGRAMVFTGEASWRWRMMLPADDHTYERFWRQAIRWLGQNAPPPLVLTLDGDSQATEVPVEVVARDAAFVPQRAATVDVQLVGSDGRRVTAPGRAIEASPGHYRVTLSAPNDESASRHGELPDVYGVVASVRRGAQELGSVSGALLARGADEEMTDPRLDTAVLSRIGRASGGALISARDIASTLERLRAAAPAVQRLQREDLWSTPWSFAILAVLLSMEWLSRRRWGLR